MRPEFKRGYCFQKSTRQRPFLQKFLMLPSSTLLNTFSILHNKSILIRDQCKTEESWSNSVLNIANIQHEWMPCSQHSCKLANVANIPVLNIRSSGYSST
ncbi:hypothetical protein CEXT_330081 [Caerostris extrusa]|uniref:Uncharacterized protein n=1 Tax=Caerostris extrusa TaxID=172846 RepID=A0AAV4X7Z7_CAEEX|nr:hypothetical protein CEXT_330081 [Caerostris extrusa]